MVSVDRFNGLTGNLAIKTPVRVATTANITLSGTQTIDGVAVVADDRVLVKNQTTTSENGIYVCKSTAWERAADFDGNRDIVKGTLIYVNAGTINASALFKVDSTDPIVIDTDSITFADAEFASAQTAADVVSAEAAAAEAEAAAVEAAASAAAAAGLFSGTSVTSLAIGTGSKVFTTQAGLNITVGQFVIAASAASPSNYMVGQVTAYSGTSLTVNVTVTGGSGTLADWNISSTGVPTSSGALVLLATSTASAASAVDFTSNINSTYKKYIIEATDVTTSGGAVVKIRLQQAGSFVSSANYKKLLNGGGTSEGSAAYNDSATAQTEISTDMSTNSTNISALYIELYSPSLVKKPIIYFRRSGYNNNAESCVVLHGTGVLGVSAATTGVSIYPSSGTISGTFKLYGVS